MELGLSWKDWWIKPTKMLRKLFHHKHSQLGLLGTEKRQEDRRPLESYILLAGSRLVKPLSSKIVLPLVQKEEYVGGWEAEPRELRAREKHSQVLKPTPRAPVFPAGFQNGHRPASSFLPDLQG